MGRRRRRGPAGHVGGRPVPLSEYELRSPRGRGRRQAGELDLGSPGLPRRILGRQSEKSRSRHSADMACARYIVPPGRSRNLPLAGSHAFRVRMPSKAIQVRRNRLWRLGGVHVAEVPGLSRRDDRADHGEPPPDVRVERGGSRLPRGKRRLEPGVPMAAIPSSPMPFLPARAEGAGAAASGPRRGRAGSSWPKFCE